MLRNLILHRILSINKLNKNKLKKIVSEFKIMKYLKMLLGLPKIIDNVSSLMLSPELVLKVVI